MGCELSHCDNSNEMQLTGSLGDSNTLVSSLNNSYYSTKPSLNTATKQKKLLEFSSDQFFKAKSYVRKFLRDSEHFPQLNEILDIWQERVYEPLQNTVMLPADLNIKLTTYSESSSVTLYLEVDGVRKFSFIQDFCEEVSRLDSRFRLLSKFEMNSRFLLSLTPLTTCFYITLGEEVDCGIGINKPLDKRQLAEFLHESQERPNISKWCYSVNSPIPVNFFYSVISTLQSVTFYFFEEEKLQNFNKGFSMFEYFGAPVSAQLQQLVKTANCEEVRCSLSFDQNSVKTMVMQVRDIPLQRSLQIGDSLDTPFYAHRWTTQSKLLGQKSETGLVLSSAGFSILKIAVI